MAVNTRHATLMVDIGWGVITVVTVVILGEEVLVEVASVEKIVFAGIQPAVILRCREIVRIGWILLIGYDVLVLV